MAGKHLVGEHAGPRPFAGRQWSRGRRLRHQDGSRLVGIHNSLGPETHELGQDTGGSPLVGLISASAALVSLVGILLCVRFRSSGRWTKFSSLKRSSRRSSKRAPREDYEDAVSTLTPHPSSVRRHCLQDYELALPITLDPPNRSREPPPHRAYEYEDVMLRLGSTGSLNGSREKSPRPHEYEDALIGHKRCMFPRYTTDSAGYTLVALEESEIKTPEEISEYNRLGVNNPKRSLSESTSPCKAYDHVILEPRSRSAGGKTSLSVRAKGVTSEGHQYDVSVVATMAEPRVEVVDKIYNRLDNMTE